MILHKTFKFFVLSICLMMISCSDNSNYKHPRDEKLYEKLPDKTKQTMTQVGMPKDTQIALSMRLNSAICSTLFDDIKNEDIHHRRSNDYRYAHRSALVLVGLGWETSEGYIAKEWTNYPITSQLWLPLDILTCTDTVERWSKIYNVGE